MVSLFAIVGDVLRPKSFAGLFGAAPSVALATLTLTILSEGNSYAALEARSMVAGAIAFFVYATACVTILASGRFKAGPTTLGLLLLWAVCAFAVQTMALR
jgi:Protein of unknown function (DUF3147)